MNEAGADLESTLTEALRRQAECYAAALQPAADMATACARGEPIDERLQQVFAYLEEVAVSESGIAAVKRQWEQAGRPAGTALRAVLDRVAVLIHQLSGELQTIENAVRSRRDRLADELDVCNRRFQMQRAYLRKS